MPDRPLHPCARAGCGALTRSRYCECHSQPLPDNRASASERGYTHKWSVAAKAYLSEHPWCAECQRQSAHIPAAEVDHITPHRGDMELFWNPKNWQGLCRRCHSQKTAREDGGFGNRRYPPPTEDSR